MSNWSEIQSQLERETARTSRLVALDNALREREIGRRAASVRADDLSDREQQRQQAIKDATACRKHQSNYNSAYRSHGLAGSPPPMQDEAPGDYRRRMLQDMINKLPPSSRFTSIKADDLDTPTTKLFEPEILGAAQAEGEQPSYENLPRDDSMVGRDHIDPETGSRRIEWFGRESFIKQLSQPGRRAIFSDPRTLSGQQRMAGALWKP